jgi:hypothetical protein
MAKRVNSTKNKPRNISFFICKEKTTQTSIKTSKMEKKSANVETGEMSMIWWHDHQAYVDAMRASDPKHNTVVISKELQGIKDCVALNHIDKCDLYTLTREQLQQKDIKTRAIRLFMSTQCILSVFPESEQKQVLSKLADDLWSVINKKE